MNEELSHNGRNVVVTGVSSGIGKAVSKTLANDGYRVFGSVRKPADADELQAELGAQFKPLIFDVCDAQSIRSHAETVMEVVGDEGISAVVNNAGLALFGPMELLEDDAFDHIMQVNVAGTRNVTNAFLPHLRRAHTVHGNSRIVNISSLSGIFNTPMNGAYCVSKHAMESLGEVYRRELLPEGIDVFSIRSGPIKSEIWKKNIDDSAPYASTPYAKMAKRTQKILAHGKRTALPAEVIAKLVLDILEGRAKRLSYHCGTGRLMSQLLSSSLMPRRLADRLVVNALNK